MNRDTRALVACLELLVRKFETRWLQEILFSKELTDNYCALGLLFESKTCNNNNKVGGVGRPSDPRAETLTTQPTARHKIGK